MPAPRFVQLNPTMSHLMLAACLMICASSVAMNNMNSLAWASPAASSSSSGSSLSSSASSSSSSPSINRQQQQPEELAEQLMDLGVQNDNINNDQFIFDLQQQQQQNLYNRLNANSNNNNEPLYSYLRAAPSSSASFITPFSSSYILTPNGGTNGNNQQQLQHLPAFLTRGAQLSGGSGNQMEPLDFDAINWNAANLMREGRAYKPKIMSTARGFGKRSFTNNNNNNLPSMLAHGINQRHVTYADLLASANPNNNYNINNNLSGHGISSKYSDWVNQALVRYPTLGDGIISGAEKYQSL